MARRYKTVDTIVGQHLALSVAAHLARTQLVPDPLAVYDARHHLEVLDVVGTALARSARLFVRENDIGESRELTPLELEGARVRTGGALLVLKDGRSLSGVTIKRGDLREAIAILKAVGIPGLRTSCAGQQSFNPPKAQSPEWARLRERLTKIEALLVFPLLPAQVDEANSLAISLARDAPHGRISNLAMHLISAIQGARNGADEDHVRTMLARLRASVEEITSARA